MKKTASILLLSILLFNWVGYQLYIAIMEQHADDALIARLDKNNYTEADLISIKVPVTYLYYYAGSTDFERVNGKIEIGGEQYNYVKRRFFNDSLEILCIPNKTATHLKSVREEFFSLVNNLQHPGHSKTADQHMAAFKSLNGKYYSGPEQFALQAPKAIFLNPVDHYLLQIPSVYLSPAIHPPDAA